MTIWTKERIDQVCAMRESGLSCRIIAQRLAPQVTRGNHIVRRFTAEEDALLLQMEANGARYCEMCRALGRRHNSIIGRLATLARRDARAEDAA